MTATEAREDDDARIFCRRFPIGWDDEEIRLEAFAATDGEEFGRVFLADGEGNRFELPWWVVADLGSAMVDCEVSIWRDHESPRAKAPGGNG